MQGQSTNTDITNAGTNAAKTAEEQRGQVAAAQAEQAQKTAAKRPRSSTRKAVKKEKRVFVSSKRKRAVARAVLKKGSGRIIVNSVDVSLVEPRELRSIMLEPVNALSLAKEMARELDISVNVSGGGRSAQAQAVRTAIAKGIAKYADSDTIRKEYLRHDRSMLVDDPRRVEPKKFRGPKARARFQTSYR
jgi:small subunit ribosomal protein S9